MSVSGWKSSALLGMMVAQALYSMIDVQFSQAAWGWRLSDKTGLDFTCSEGNIGCNSTMAKDGPCTAANYTCTVTATAGKSCNVATTTMKCSKNASAATLFQPDQGACINKGEAFGLVTDSQLHFDPAPVCQNLEGGSTAAPTTAAPTTAAAAASSGSSTSGGTSAAATSALVLLMAGVLAVIN